MSKSDDGGSAFPVPVSFLERQHSREAHRFTHDIKSDGGMSLRAYIATNALTGIMASREQYLSFLENKHIGVSFERSIAAACVAQADALIAELEKSGGSNVSQG